MRILSRKAREKIRSNAPRYLSLAAATYALGGGLLSFIGWSAGIDRLTDWPGSGINIKPNAALAAMGAGAALILAVLFPARYSVVRLLAVLIASVGAITLLEHVTGWSPGIDTLLFDEPVGARATAAPGRMGPPASLSFLAIGVALALLTGNFRARGASIVIGVAVLAIAALSLTGHLYGAQAMYAIPRLTGISVQTATMIAALSIGLIAACPDRQPMRTLYEDSNAGVLARRLVPLLIVVPVVLGWLRLRGQQAGLYDTAFGTALRTVVELAIFGGLLWWSVQAIRARDIRQRRAEQRKDEFLATLAHELRNPLAPIRNAAELLLTKDLPESTRQWGAAVISRQVQHMARLLEDLLDVSRISRDRLELRTERVELRSVIESALETSRPVIEHAGHELTVSLPAGPIYVEGDAVRLAQVFSNLLNNAAKYTERPGHVALTAHGEGREVVIRVTDDGIGIAPDMLPRIFEMFAQVDSTRQHTQAGLGIGLSLASALVTRHRGTIEARSDGLSAGSEFIVRLPKVTEVDAAVQSRSIAAPGRTASRRLLVVDDVHDSADSLSMLLKTLGHEVRTVYDGAAAIEAAEAFRPEAIFLDLGMPAMDGFEVCRRLRQTPLRDRVFITALTGWGQAADRRRTDEAGFDHHLIKPADPAVLEALLTAIPSHQPGVE